MGIAFLFSLVIPNFSFAQIPDIEMKANLKKGDYVETNNFSVLFFKFMLQNLVLETLSNLL